MEDQTIYFMSQKAVVVESLLLFQKMKEYARTHLVELDYSDNYTEYLDYVNKCCNIPKPKNWREALNIRQMLLSISKPAEI